MYIGLGYKLLEYRVNMGRLIFNQGVKTLKICLARLGYIWC